MASEIPTRTPNGFLVVVGSAALLVAVAVVFIGAICMTGSGDENLEQKRAAKRVEIRTKLEKDAQERLNSTGWVDKAKGSVHIPIHEAIVAVVAELKARKPTVSQVKVEPPLPVPVADPNSKEPPPPALPSAPQGADTIRFTYPTAAPEAAPAPAPPAPAAATPTPAAAPAKSAEPPPAPAAPAAAPAPAPTTPPPPAPVPVTPPPAVTAPPPAPAPVPATPPLAPATPPGPVPATPPAPAPAVQPAPANAPAPAPAPAAPNLPVNPAPAAAPEAPARPPIINPTETSEPTK